MKPVPSQYLIVNSGAVAACDVLTEGQVQSGLE